MSHYGCPYYIPRPHHHKQSLTCKYNRINIYIIRERESNNFEVTVNIEAGKEVEFDLEYQEVLQRRLGYYEHVINIDPGQVVLDLEVEVNINESRPITKLKVLPIRKDDAKDLGGKLKKNFFKLAKIILRKDFFPKTLSVLYNLIII